MFETHTRSILKSLTWRIAATLISLVTAYVYTGSVSMAAAISLSAAAVSIVLYYVHERLWNAIRWGRTPTSKK